MASIPTSDNPADIGSRGGSVNSNELWRKGLPWLKTHPNGPLTSGLEPTPETKTEAKQVKEIFAIATAKRDIYDELLDKYKLDKLLRIGVMDMSFHGQMQERLSSKGNRPNQNERGQGTTIVVDTKGPEGNRKRPPFLS